MQVTLWIWTSSYNRQRCMSWSENSKQPSYKFIILRWIYQKKKIVYRDRDTFEQNQKIMTQQWKDSERLFSEMRDVFRNKRLSSKRDTLGRVYSNLKKISKAGKVLVITTREWIWRCCINIFVSIVIFW